MLGKLKLSQEGADLYARAEASRLDGDFESAATLYLDLSARMERSSWAVIAARARACAAFCHAFAVVKNTGSLEEADGILSKAAKEFGLCDDLANLRRTNAFRKSIEAGTLAGDLDYEEAANSFRSAAQQCRSLKKVFPEEAAALEVAAREFELESCISDLTFLALFRRFDDCKVSVAAVNETFEALKAIVQRPDSLAYLESRFRFAVTIVPMIRGQFALHDFRIAEALQFLQQALPSAEQTHRVLVSSACGGAWKQLAAHYEGVRASCAAAIRHAETVQRLTCGELFDAARSLAEVSALYEVAAEAHARAGTSAGLGLKSCTDMRDQLKGLADLISSRLDAEMLEIPQFALFTERADFRAEIESDYRELLSCYMAGAWKMCLTCIGAILEAILLDQIATRWADCQQQYPNLQGKLPEVVTADWTLGEYIGRAAKIGIIPANNACIFDDLRCYRNHIHPSLTPGGLTHVDHDVATRAFRALKWVIANLSKP